MASFAGSDVIKTSTSIVGNLEEWQTKARAKVKAGVAVAVEEQANRVLATAKSLCPVGNNALVFAGSEHDKHPGNLRDSLHVQISKEGLFASVRADHKKAPYAYLVHFGSKHNKPQPFLYQAADIHRPELAPAIEAEIIKSR